MDDLNPSNIPGTPEFEQQQAAVRYYVDLIIASLKPWVESVHPAASGAKRTK